MAARPQVLDTSPSNYATSVPTNTSLTVDFSIDLDSRYVDAHVYLTDSRGVHIDARVIYRKKRITVTPTSPLEPGKTYQLTLIGDANLDDDTVEGIRSIVGDSLAGNFVVNFTTDGESALEPPTLTSPAYGSVNRTNPIFSWDAVETADWYELRISKSNRFDVIDFPLDPLQKFHDTSIEPNVSWAPGIYYWAVRAVKNDNTKGEWSDMGQFSIAAEVEPGTISPEDQPPVEVLYEEPNFDIEMIEVFPKDGVAGVPLNIQSIYFRVIGEIDVSLIDADSFRLVGTHITSDPAEDTHGEVSGTMSIVSGADGTTYIVFTPDELPAET